MYEEKKIKLKKRKKSKQIFPLTSKKTKKKKNIKITFSHLNIFRNYTFLEKIDWKKLWIKLGILMLVMLLIIFTISRLNKYHKREDEIFNNNIAKVTKSTLKYFEENPLPINIGDSSSLLIDEMIKLEILDEVKEKDKYCDYLNSYVIFTKVSSIEYRLKTYLDCPKKKKIVEQTITCENNHCETK